MSGRRLNLTGKNANDIYMISFPNNLLTFIKYDFSVFMERATDLCRMYQKTGECKPEEISEVRNSIAGCHKYFEQNLRTIFDKIVVDCWIEYICRQNEIGIFTLWNDYLGCKNDFERVVFTRLSEYRHNYAINQWVNLLKIQEYAARKVDFIFGAKLRGSAEAASKANYFDLMFNVTANELGFDLSGIADNRVFSIGRTPNSPFIMSGVSREIVRNLLTDVNFNEENPRQNKGKVPEFLSDQAAMDAFSAVKAYIPTDPDNIVTTMIKSMPNVPYKVYIPTSFKAVIDLEIDALIESGAILQRCLRCKEYFTKDENYTYDYCDRVNREGRSCIEIVSAKNAAAASSVKSADINKPGEIFAESSLPSLADRCDQLYKEMSARVGEDITQRDFSDWYRYMILIREKVQSGEAAMSDFENFVEYSRSINFSYRMSGERIANAIDFDEIEPRLTDSLGLRNARENSGQPKARDHQDRESRESREPRPFVFERIDRSSITNSGGEPLTRKQKQRERDAFLQNENDFTYDREPKITSHIIRGAQVMQVPPSVQSFEAAAPVFLEEEAPVPAESIAAAYRPVPEPQTDTREPEEYVKVFSPGKRSPVTPSPVTPSPVTPPPVPVVAKQQARPVARQEAVPVKPNRAAAVSQNRQSLSRVSESAPRNNRDNHLSDEAADYDYNTDNIRISPVTARVGGNRGRAATAYRQSAGGYDDFIQDEPKVAAQPVPQTVPVVDQRSIQFNDILRGISRKDGFETEDNIPTDADGIPVSHKTKRVMDTVNFKQSKPSLYLGPGLRIDDKKQ